MKEDEGAAPVGRSVFTDAGLRAARLIREGALEAARDAVAAHGHAEDAEALYREARGRVGYLERCLAEAQAVLGGDLGASTRLWLLLREPVEGADVPASAVEEAAARARSEPPRLLDGDSLLRLVAGTVRAANRPDEADRMLDALGRLLQPLFLLDFAATAAGDSPPAQDGALRTLLFARRAPQWRDALAASHADPNRPPAPDPPTPGPPGGGRPFRPDRDKFDHDSWLVDASDAAKGVGVSLWPCLDEARKGMSMIDIFGGRYQIDSLSNPSACPGQTLTIRGSGFGPQGRVSFPIPDLNDPAFQLGLAGPGHPMLAGVEPVRWTDTEIDVVVPPWATSGELRLYVFRRHSDPCMDVDVHRLGNSITFRGGLARVFRVFINSAEVDLDGKKLPNVDPRDVTTLTWHASSGPGVQIHAALDDGGLTLWSQANLPGGFGAALITPPTVNGKVKPMVDRPTLATLVLTASGPCGAAQPLRIPVYLSVRPRLTVEYVEVTQGVQEGRGEVDAGRGMPLVATKDTAVRVHISCDRGGWLFDTAERVTGSLRLDNHPPLAPTNVRNFVPDRGFMTVERTPRPESTGGTLNFLIPAAWLTPGQHTVAVRVVYDDPGGRDEAWQAVRPTWHFKLPMRVRCLYLGRRTNYVAADLLDFARRALDLIPTPLTDVGMVGRMWHKRDSEDEDFWDDLCDDVEDAWDDADPPEGLRWLGIFPISEYNGGTTRGIAPTPGNVAVTISNDHAVAAHELGHSSGLEHINLPPGKPKGPYHWADNGGLHRRPPFDVRNGAAWSLPAGDLMSYQRPMWPGVTTWVRLFNKVF